jgi:hypothetical protein
MNERIKGTRGNKAQSLPAGVRREVTVRQADDQNTHAADDQAVRAEAQAAVFASHGVESPRWRCTQPAPEMGACRRSTVGTATIRLRPKVAVDGTVRLETDASGLWLELGLFACSGVRALDVGCAGGSRRRA